jgi:hypothetical protein
MSIKKRIYLNAFLILLKNLDKSKFKSEIDPDLTITTIMIFFGGYTENIKMDYNDWLEKNEYI